MSLLRNLERRTLTSTAYMRDPSAIPSNSDLVVSPLLVSGQGALRHWAVWACARVISDAVSTLPVDLLKGSGSSATPVEALPTILVRPSAHLSRVDWLGQVMLSLLTTGNAYGLIASRDYYGYPTQINIMAPGSVVAQIDPDTGAKVYRGPNGGTLPADMVWHRTSGLVWPGEVIGMDPVSYFARTISLGLEAERYGADYYGHGAHPTAVASTDQQVDKDQAEQIKSRIRTAVAGRDIAVLGAGMKLDPWQGSPNDAQLLETIRMNAAMVCAIYGVPPEKIGVSVGSGGTLTYATRVDHEKAFLDDAVMPWLVRLQDEMSGWFPRGTFVRFNTAGRLMPHQKERFEGYAIATGNKPWMLPSEARALENWAPVDGIDDAPQPPDGGANVNPQV